MVETWWKSGIPLCPGTSRTGDLSPGRAGGLDWESGYWLWTGGTGDSKSPVMLRAWTRVLSPGRDSSAKSGTGCGLGCNARAGAVGAWADPTIPSSDDSAASSENEAFAATTPPVRHWVGGGNGRQFWRGASPPAQSPLRARANTSLLPCRPHAEMPSTAAGAEHATLLPLYRGDNPFTSC